MLNFDIVIVTRNRHDYLKLSIPLMLRQSRLPANFIVIDSSDDHEKTKQVVNSIFNSTNVDCNLCIHKSGMGIPLQRNVGMQFVRSPIVFFPDDDALWFDGFAQEVMSVYEMDVREEIGAVAGTASQIPPPGTITREEAYKQLEFRDLLGLYLNKPINKLMDGFFPDPLFVEGNSRIEKKDVPLWLKNNSAEISNLMTGFLMSFRTGVIKRKGFDESLGQYAIFEDRDASLSVLDTHLIARAVNAKVFHYRSPDKRESGFKWGFTHILNLAYIVCKHTSDKTVARKYLKRFFYYKLFFYLLQSQTAYGRARVAGAWSAMQHLSAFLTASKENLPEVYISVKEKYLSGK